MSPKSLLSFSIFFLLNSTITLALNTPQPSKPINLQNSSTIDFIRSKCNSTLYPSFCFHSLIHFSSQIHNNHINIARAATNITLSHVLSLSSHISSLSHLPSITSRDALVLHDCKDSIGDAVDLVKQSVDEIGWLETAVGPEVAWRVSNAQTWMSAAITNEDTCQDGFENGVVVGGDGGVSKVIKDDVCGRVWRVKMHSSVALALVNSLVYS